MNEELENQILIGEKYYSKDYLYKIGKGYKTKKLAVLLGLGITFLIVCVISIFLFLCIYFDDREGFSDLFWLPFFMLVYFFAPGLVFTIIACQAMKRSRCIESGIAIIKNQQENANKKADKIKLIKTEPKTSKFYQSVSFENHNVDIDDEEDDEDIDDEEDEHNVVVLEALRLKAIQMGWDENEMSLEEFISYFM